MPCVSSVLLSTTLALLGGSATTVPASAAPSPELSARMRVAATTPERVTPFPGLERTVAMPWDGPLEPVVMRLAAAGGYEVRILGRSPAAPIQVQLGSEAAAISEQLRSLGMQAGERADVAIAPMSSTRKGVVVIEYRAPPPPPPVAPQSAPAPVTPVAQTVPVVPVFRVRAGEMFSEVLNRWGGAEQASVVWRSSNDYRLAADATFTGELMAALEQLTGIVAKTSPALRVRMYANGVIVVTEGAE